MCVCVFGWCEMCVCMCMFMPEAQEKSVVPGGFSVVIDWNSFGSQECSRYNVNLRAAEAQVV